MRKMEGAKGRGCDSKNGAVAENPSVRSIPPSSKCPECGSEMDGRIRNDGQNHYYDEWTCPKCGHKEKVEAKRP